MIYFLFEVSEENEDAVFYGTGCGFLQYYTHWQIAPYVFM